MPGKARWFIHGRSVKMNGDSQILMVYLLNGILALSMWRTVFAEDIQVVEGMQKGRHVKAFDGGKFSAVMDGPTYQFHKWVAKALYNY